MPQNVDLTDDQVERLLSRVADAAVPPTHAELHRLAALATTGGRPAERDSRRRSRRGRLVLAVAAALLLLGTGATAYVLTGDNNPPHRLQVAMTSLFSRQDCLSARDATALIQAELGRLELNDWTVVSRPGASGERCVIAGLDAANLEVVLLPVERPEVVDALHSISDRLMAECLSEDEARALIGSVLDGLGVSGWEIATDGPVGYPIGEREAVESHIAAGCAVMGGSGHDADGSLLIFITPTA